MVPTVWRKSSFSDAVVNCVEVAWRKSSYSEQEVNCVELALREDIAGIRDSKNPGAGHLTLGASAFRSLLSRAKRS